VRGNEIAHLAVDVVEPGDGIEQPTLFLAEIALRVALDPLAQLFLAVGAGEDALEVESGKRLPLAFQQGKHLPERFTKRIAGHQSSTLRRKPAAIIASAILVGTTG